MTFAFRALSPGLYETANAAIDWFIRNWGVKRSRVNVEAEFDPDISFRPTFNAQLDDGHLLCIEVSQHIYSPTLDSVALACLQRGLPVLLYTAVPKDISDPDYSRKLKSAKMVGTGVLEVNNRSGTIVQSAVSLSLVGLRALQLTNFPPKYRQALQHANQTFRDGEPSKACSLVFDELEAAFRLFAKKTLAKKLWQNTNNRNLDTGPWARILNEVDETLSRKSTLTRRVTPTLLARVKGMTAHRNESGHKPHSLSELIRRDQALRTRFESAVDLLRDFLEAARGLRI
jgi:hypothetical protein